MSVITTNSNPIRAPAAEPTITKKLFHSASSDMSSTTRPGGLQLLARGPEQALVYVHRFRLADGEGNCPHERLGRNRVRLIVCLIYSATFFFSLRCVHFPRYATLVFILLELLGALQLFF